MGDCGGTSVRKSQRENDDDDDDDDDSGHRIKSKLAASSHLRGGQIEFIRSQRT